MSLLAEKPHLRAELLLVHDFGTDFADAPCVPHFDLLPLGGSLEVPLEILQLLFGEPRRAQLLLDEPQILLQVPLLDGALASEGCLVSATLRELSVDPESVCITADYGLTQRAFRDATGGESHRVLRVGRDLGHVRRLHITELKVVATALRAARPRRQGASRPCSAYLLLLI